LENLATLQRLELLLKFAAKTEENFVWCFHASWKGFKEAPSAGTQELPGRFSEHIFLRNLSNQFMPMIPCWFQTLWGSKWPEIGI
jgi:hypothetical protein